MAGSCSSPGRSLSSLPKLTPQSPKIMSILTTPPTSRDMKWLVRQDPLIMAQISVILDSSRETARHLWFYTHHLRKGENSLSWNSSFWGLLKKPDLQGSNETLEIGDLALTSGRKNGVGLNLITATNPDAPWETTKWSHLLTGWHGTWLRRFR